MNGSSELWNETFLARSENRTKALVDEGPYFGLASFLAVLAVTLALLISSFGKRLLTGKLSGIPGPGRNVFESTYIFLKFFKKAGSLSNWLQVGTKLYGKDGLYQFNVFSMEHAVICSAETAEAVLNNIVHVEKPMGYVMIREFFGQSLPVCTAAIWKKRRRILNPAFNNQVIDRYIPTFNEKAKELKDSLVKGQGTTVDFDPIVTVAAISAIMETALGLKWQDSLTYEEVETVTTEIHRISRQYNQRLTTPWQWMGPIYAVTTKGRQWKRSCKKYSDITFKIITNRKEELDKKREKSLSSLEDEGSTRERASFLDLLLNMHMNEKSIDMQVIQDEVKAFLFAGHDTVSISLSWTLFLLGHHQDIQRNVQKEIDDVMGERSEVEADDLKQLLLLERVFKESVRLFPAGPFIGRKLCDTVKTAGYTIPKGTELLVSIFDVHRDPKNFPDPERFDPDRFLPENSAKRNPYSFIGFSGGPRGCIGQRFAIYEGKIFLAWILRHFTVHSVMPYEDVQFTREIMLRSRTGMPLIFKNRFETVDPSLSEEYI